jgi:asparagine synthase (glutamine-hydrolysing)
MCGFHLIIAKKKSTANIDQALERMMQASAYRGPDANRALHWQDNRQQIYLGAQRLKITDLSDRANQPFVSPDERYALLYNGELYNFYELRNRLLAQGETFSTYSDTEVVLKMLTRQGPAALQAFEGMFALAFYDRREESLLLARDTFGIKPLYYAETDSLFLASSSSRSLAVSGLVSTEIDPEQIDHYLYFRYPQKGRTLYQQIHPLPEKSYLSLSPEQNTQIQQYAPPSPPANEQPPATTELLHQTEELLKDAVLRHIATDVPTGLFLSGGVDSTLLLALIKETGAPPIPTFSIVNDAKEKNFGTRDYHYSRLAAEQYGSYHQEVPLNSLLFTTHFEDFVRKMDQPVGDSGAMMTYLLSQQASQRVKVVLSGAGADELFGGYNRHAAYYFYLKHYRWFTKLRGLGKSAATLLPTGFPHPFRKTFRLLKKYAHSVSDDPATTFQQFIGFPALGAPSFNSTITGSVLPADPNFVEHYLFSALEHDQRYYLIEDVLQISDRSSMAHSLELRVPYLDAPVVRYIQSLPAIFRILPGKKWILKQLLSRYGGQPYIRRAKEGFGLPFGHWLRHESLPVVQQYLDDPQQPIYQFISPEKTRHLLKMHRSGRHDFSAEIWLLLLLSAWLSLHVE